MDGDWLKTEFKVLLDAEKPKGYESAKCSDGWLNRWCKRYCVSSRNPSNTKSLTVEERIDKVKRFHAYIRHIRMKAPLRDPVYGRFPAKATISGSLASDLIRTLY